MGPSHQPSQKYWAIVWRQFRRNRLALGAGIVILLLFAMAIAAPLLAGSEPVLMSYQGRLYAPVFFKYPEFALADFKDLVENRFGRDDWAMFPMVPYGPADNDVVNRLKPPDAEHWLGTDAIGRDLLSRLIHGSRISLAVGFVAVGIYVLIGVLVGSVAAFYGGRVDTAAQRLIEVVICFPVFFLIIAVLAFVGPSLVNIMVVIGVTGWTQVARLVRGEVLRTKKLEFVTAARALGASDAWIIFRHILPNSLAPVLVAATFGVAGAIIVESSLSFLGFGVQPPTPSWGEALSQSKEFVSFAYWLVIFPGLAIFTTVTAYNLVGEGLRDAIDPKLK